MKRKYFLAAVLMGLAGAMPWQMAFAVDSTSDGSNGDLVAAAGVVTTIDLPANGVLQYNSLSIPATATVRFRRNASNTPVYLLVRNNATISGAIDLSGEAGVDLNNTLRDGQAGPGGAGGFDGGAGGKALPEIGQIGAGGFGPGAGRPGDYSYQQAYGTYPWGGSGGASTVGTGTNSYFAVGGLRYGSTIVDTVLGGSGGGGGGAYSTPGAGGGGGGGAIFLVVGGTLNMPTGGAIRANGGKGGNTPGTTGAGGGGGGGAIRIAATNFTGAPTLSAMGGGAGDGNLIYRNGGVGANGRIRIEADNATFSGGSITPSNLSCINAGCKPVALPVLPNNVAVSTLPSVRFSAVDGVSIAPERVLTGTGDIALSGSRADPTNVTITLTTANVPLGKNPVAIITVRPDRGAVTTYTVSAWSGSDASATGSATTIKLPLGRNVVSASLGFSN
jgi:hypothetical protein